ncbi:DUF1800 family protein [Candidatus Uabimicrobium sp. HlEnr_7]|uniref:DUF1800 domain-containing protein n=1 Tax=Candidatus Uabimicrobium helgolandensis TaxID=3095367 RepID=UPI00355673B7
MYIKHFVIITILSITLSALEYEEARHLLSRTGFGGTPAEIDEILPLTYVEAVDKLLKQLGNGSVISAPEWTEERPQIKPRKNKALLQVMSEGQKREYRKLMRQKRRQKSVHLKMWWFKQMITTDSPFTERMVLFFHNHFTSSFKKVKFPYLLYKQNMLFRKYITGNFRELTQMIAKDPAMILYLDNQTNRKDKPNENFARELLELFTLGEGNYTEQDIKQGARAFTGWMVNKKNGLFQFNKRQHDDGEKTFMDKSGNFNGSDIIDIVFQNPQVANYLVTKLWIEFISPTPDKEEVSRLAQLFIDNDYEMLPLLRALFLSSHFRTPTNYGKQIKSPVELIVGTVRMFKVHITNHRQLVQYSKQLGQDLFDPPNVKGWPGGNEWITSHTLLARRQMLERALRGSDMFLQRFWVWHYIDKNMKMSSWTGLGLQEKEQKIQQLLLPVAPVNNIEKPKKLLPAIKNLVFDLSYQLK